MSAARPDPLDDTRGVALPDGRTLSFADYGDRRGVPVVAHHGSNGGHERWREADGACRAAGVRLIVPDRPGYGASTPQPGRRVVDWPADFVTLVDALALDSVAVLSRREGVAYATAAAALLPGRVERAALVSCTRPSRAAVLRACANGACSPSVREDLLLCSLDWGFDLGAVTVPTTLWVAPGVDPQRVPALRRIRAALPHATVAVDDATAVLDELRAAPL